MTYKVTPKLIENTHSPQPSQGTNRYKTVAFGVGGNEDACHPLPPVPSSSRALAAPSHTSSAPVRYALAGIASSAAASCWRVGWRGGR